MSSSSCLSQRESFAFALPGRGQLRSSKLGVTTYRIPHRACTGLVSTPKEGNAAPHYERGGTAHLLCHPRHHFLVTRGIKAKQLIGRKKLKHSTAFSLIIDKSPLALGAIPLRETNKRLSTKTTLDLLGITSGLFAGVNLNVCCSFSRRK